MKNKIILIITIILVVFVVFVTYYNIFISKNYSIILEVPCDPNVNNCFISECTDDCNNNSISYYMLVKRKASSILYCEKEDYNCLLCKENEKDCSIILCDPLEDKDMCSN